MATFTRFEDELKRCPYNPLHKVSARRFAQHVIKCAKQNPTLELVDCPFNALHKIPKDAYKEHLITCKDNRQVIREMDEARSIHQIPANSNPAPLNYEPSDDWDNQPDPKVKNYVLPGFRINSDQEEDQKDSEFRVKTQLEIQALKPAQRKAYYNQLVERTKNKAAVEENEAQSRANPESSQDHSPGPDPGSSTEPDPVVNKTEVESELRKPRSVPFLGGVGRGRAPSRSESSDQGSSRGPLVGIKREHDSGDSPLKRFSPDSF